MKLPKFPVLSAIEWGAAALALVAALVLLWNFDPFGRRERAEQKAATATVQAEVSTEAAKIAGDVATDTNQIHRKAREVQDALDASTDMDSDLAIWSAGIDRVLDSSDRPSNSAGGKPDDQDGGPG